MKRVFLKSKLHGLTVTESRIDYEGSLCLDEALIEAAGLLPFEKVHVYNLTTGDRFSTYLIKGERGSGACKVYGAAAHKAKIGHRLIVVSYVLLDEGEVEFYSPRIVLIKEKNEIAEIR
ncbi:MAG: aspartate 1-decarboxylase [Candidatus Aminicenantes bacterium]|nr:aspartate 1-decarboxylase [Candidatus Aminicenantes bacterium]